MLFNHYYQYQNMKMLVQNVLMLLFYRNLLLLLKIMYNLFDLNNLYLCNRRFFLFSFNRLFGSYGLRELVLFINCRLCRFCWCLVSGIHLIVIFVISLSAVVRLCMYVQLLEVYP